MDKCRRPGKTPSRPPPNLGDNPDPELFICRPPMIVRPRHWSSSLHLHAVTPLPGPARPTNMLLGDRRPRTAHPHGFRTTGSALAICHCLLCWPCCRPSLTSTYLSSCPRPGLGRPAPNRGGLGDVSVYDLDVSDHWSSPPFSNFQQPSMPVSMLPRGGLGRNGCSACSLPPRDPTVVTVHWCLESERYTIDSGA
jgi:hypothetical protein